MRGIGFVICVAPWVHVLRPASTVSMVAVSAAPSTSCSLDEKMQLRNRKEDVASTSLLLQTSYREEALPTSSRHNVAFQDMSLQTERVGFPNRVVQDGVRSSRGMNLWIRYALTDPTADDTKLTTSWVPALRASICHCEKNLAPAMQQHVAFGGLPSYLIYVDNRSVNMVTEMIDVYPGDLKQRVKVLNLDLDPYDAARLSRFNKMLSFPDMTAANLASVRRILADGQHMGPGSARLLLGLDVKFVKDQKYFLDRAASLGDNQALYMVDDKGFGGLNYTIRGYAGPQCPGLLADFVYLSPRVEVGSKSIAEKMLWYLAQPPFNNRTIPDCCCCDGSHGLHAADQFVWMMALAEAVTPRGMQGCFGLDPQRFTHFALYPSTEVVHDKSLPACGGWPNGTILLQPQQRSGKY